MRRRFAALLALSTLVPYTAFAAEPVCRQFIDGMRERAVAVLHNPQMSIPEKRANLIAVFNAAVDVPATSRTAAGAYWRNASIAERSQYETIYATYLPNYYIGSMDEDGITSIENVALIKFKIREPNHYLARLEITQKNDDPGIVDVQLTEEPIGTCRITDFSAEGVGMLTSQQEEIGSLGAKGGLPFIIEKLFNVTRH
jgi:phospholipid transport system substrate-binding protein